MNHRSIKQKLLRTHLSLKQTLQSILDINRKRKMLKSNELHKDTQQLEEELRILNQLASNQAVLLKKYESSLSLVETEVN